MRAEQGDTIWIKQVSVKNGNSVKKKKIKSLKIDYYFLQVKAKETKTITLKQKNPHWS